MCEWCVARWGHARRDTICNWDTAKLLYLGLVIIGRSPAYSISKKNKIFELLKTNFWFCQYLLKWDTISCQYLEFCGVPQDTCKIQAARQTAPNLHAKQPRVSHSWYPLILTASPFVPISLTHRIAWHPCITCWLTIMIPTEKWPKMDVIVRCCVKWLS
jgi:hypothetical protein